MSLAEPPTVVIVEDEEVVSLFLRECLCEAGFQVQTFPDAETALQVDDDSPIDVAVIDVGLPHQTGDELARQWRARHPNLAIILATGYDEGRFEKIFASDARTRVLAKPFDIPRLLLQFDALGVYPSPH